MINRIIKKIAELYRLNLWSAERYARFLGVKVGNGCFISTKKFSSEPYLIEIGNHVRIASHVSFFTHGGVWSQRKKYPELDYFGKIRIGDYTYIGEGVYILPGVNIGKDVIVGAGSVVTRSIKDGCIVAGNPAKVVGSTCDFIEKIKSLSLPTKNMSYDDKKKYLLSQDDSKFLKKSTLD